MCLLAYYDKLELGTQALAVVGILTSYPGSTPSQLAKLLDLRSDTTAKVLKSLQVGGFALQTTEVPPSIVQVLQGAILFTLIASDVLLRYRVRLRRSSTATAAAPTPA